MIVDHLVSWKSYSLGEAWEKAFAFLETLSPDAEEKEYPIDGDEIFARVMSYETKSEENPAAVLEAHRRYADIQMALVDAERIAVYPAHVLKTKDVGYIEERDVEFYRYEEPAKLQLAMTPGTFALLLPQDAHMPGLHPYSAPVTVKKVVVKVAMSRLSL